MVLSHQTGVRFPVALFFTAILLLFSADIYAKTRFHESTQRADAINSSPSPAEIEARFRPFLEQKINDRDSRRGSKDTRPAASAPRSGANRPTLKDIRALMRAWDSLSPEFRALYKKASDIEPGDYQHTHVSPSGKFKIFYSTSGADSVDVTDTIGYGTDGDPSAWRERRSGRNNVPDYIDEVALALDSSWAMIVDRFGFAEPANAPAPGGSTEHYCVLVSFIDDYGGTWPYEKRSVSGPGFSSYIEVNSNWSAPYWAPYDKRPYDALRVTCAHELLHAAQYAMAWTDVIYDDLPIGWLEGSAVLMEELAFPEINDYLQYITTYFSNPAGASMLSFTDYRNPYMNSILFKYLYEKTSPTDSIGITRDVHHNYHAQKTLPFHTNIEQASREHARRDWAETLNGFHAESYFTGSRARRPWAFVSDAELMGTWRAPTATAQATETKTVRPYSAEFFRYAPREDHPDTLILTVNGARNTSISGKTWAASVLVMENGDSIGITRVPMDQNGNGRFELAGWKEKAGCLLVTTNASPNSSRSVTVKMEGSAGGDTNITAKALKIYPNVVKKSSVKPVRISGDNISEIRILTPDGKSLGYYSGSRSAAGNSAFSKAEDGTVEWYPGRRLVPGVCYISATSINPVSNRKSVQKRKIMILP